MANNTTRGHVVEKFNVIPSTTIAGAANSGGSTRIEHFKWFGTFVANGVTPVTVTEPNITANCVVSICLKTVGGTVGAIPAIQTITAGTGFTVAATASDTSTYAYCVEGWPT